ncbi:MAG: hypothetical protein GY811_24185 [Myxococcales bacterium]|nr:hypothetical protein [Myxococcales bacterium]
MSTHSWASARGRLRWVREGFGGTLCALATLACTAQSPYVEPQPSRFPDAGGPAYVDLVVSYSQDGVPVTCTDSLAPVCQAQEGACGDHAVLGAPDGQSFSMQGASQLEVGFLCQPIVDRAPNSDLSPDFVIWGNVESGSGAVVSVSEDGSNFVVLDSFVSDDQSFDLSSGDLEYVRFVRIASQSGAALSIDAIEALP